MAARLIDLEHAGGQLLGGVGDLVILFPHHGGGFDDGLEIVINALDGLAALRNLTRQAFQQILGAAGGFGRFSRQIPHLLGHHRETGPGPARARGLDGGVERQQVGLGGDGIDGLNDFPRVAKRNPARSWWTTSFAS